MAHPVDPGSDVDWDPPEDTEAAMPIVREKVPPEMRPFPLKRRLKQKTNVRRFAGNLPRKSSFQGTGSTVILRAAGHTED